MLQKEAPIMKKMGKNYVVLKTFEFVKEVGLWLIFP